ncbi:DUF1127 domain-containing protein [Yoonia sediminilitoris]|uniref:Uncharacterized protein YjiS (DUF1127 family) n=1 Tax=Yoonia sediminilitoris TaxID=1286148 RepID=A0A2T6KPN6_9RHOB|nr:DUF1127 domain-containing protein [Yoonia sediminilitoris]PUB18533.1 uncharacterized protein YjiS (DUF1127 family) [Yoonia sediminilitoris]RCW98701.1 uncharacterized protein YjiS (DUF1127 family) [Yoonia sediminilitoris]
MAAIDTSRPVAGSTAGRIFSVFFNIADTFSAWKDARATRNALSKLTTRELDDIGLCTSDIEAVATRSHR